MNREAVMKANSPGFEITPAMVEDAEREKDRLEQIINDAQRKHGLILQFLRLAAVYKAEPELDGAEKPEETAKTDTSGEDIDPSNMMGTVARIANESPKPLTKSEMKTKLIEVGTPEARLGSYFYVAIDRLKKKERISVLEDGRIWKALPKN
jgi:hypothetical protein